MPSPIRRPKPPTLRKRQPRKSIPICCIEIYSISCPNQHITHQKILQKPLTPPIWKHSSRICNAEENNNRWERKSGIQSRSKDIIIFRFSPGQLPFQKIIDISGKLTPPSKPPPLNPLIKNNIHQRPARVIDSRRGRDVVRAHKNQRPIDESNPVSSFPIRFLLVFPYSPTEHRHEGAYPEEVQEARVDFPDRVDASRADSAPNNRGGEDSAAVGAGEA